MRRSVCISSPASALAGQESDWSFSYTTANALPKGTKILFDLLSLGRPFDWDIPATTSSTQNSQIWAELEGKKMSAQKAEEVPSSIARFEFTLPSEVKTGETLTIFIGGGKTKSRSQTHTQRKRPFHLYIDPKGVGDYKEPEIFYIDIKGNELAKIRVLTPSLVARNKRFDVVLRFEDQYGNLTSKAPENTLIELSYEHLRENLNWKLFVPESGFITLPNLYFNEPGTYKIQLRDLTAKKHYASTPIKCFAESEFSLFWGTFHGESTRYDALENIEPCLRFFRDNKALQFYGVSPFEPEEEISQDEWKQVCTQVSELNEDERFPVFAGFQYVGTPKEEGIRQFVYSKDNRPILRKKDTKSNSLKKIYKTYPIKEMVAIPSFTMGQGYVYDFKEFDPMVEKVVEIYNAWGSSECTKAEGNLRPIEGTGPHAIKEDAEGSIRKALNNGYRFGFVAGGLDDRGIYKNLYDANQTQYSPGLTALLAKDHSRSSLFEALQARRCYATTGTRMILGFNIAQEIMGSELDNRKKPGLDFNRHITAHAVCSTPIQEVEIFRNGKLLTSFTPNEVEFECTYDDQEPVEKITLQTDREAPFAYYYLRVILADGHIGWSSPIWIDFHPKKAKVKKG